MIEINDAGAARTRYEYALMQAKVPRQFWSQIANEIEFEDLVSVQAEPIQESKKKAAVAPMARYTTLAEVRDTSDESKIAKTLSAREQNAAWNNLLNLVHHWTPRGLDSLETNQTAVFFSPNLKDAQLCAMTLAHYMLARTFLMPERPYKIEVVRAFELWHRFQVGPEDSHTLPHIAILPTLMADVSSAQQSMMSELLSSGFRMIVATNQTPQDFYNTYGEKPTHTFVVRAVKTRASAVDFVRAVQGAK